MKYALLALLCIGCGGYPIHTEAEVPDAAPDVAETSTPHNPGSLCCTGPTNPVWGNVWQCDQEGGAPWICGLDDGGVVFACDDPRCNVGDWCQGITGYGTVGLCPDD